MGSAAINVRFLATRQPVKGALPASLSSIGTIGIHSRRLHAGGDGKRTQIDQTRISFP